MYTRSREIAKSARESALTHVGSIHLVKRSQERIEERSTLSGGRQYHVGEGGSILRYSCSRESTGHSGLVPATTGTVARGFVSEERDDTAKGGTRRRGPDLPLSRVSRAACMTFLRRRPSPARALVIVLVKVAPVLVPVLTSSPFAHSSVVDVVAAVDAR